MSTVPEKRVNKNGHLVTKHVNPDKGATGGSRTKLAALAVAPPVPDATPLYRFSTPIPQRFYHITLHENKDSLLAEGIEPRIGENSHEIGEDAPRIYLFPNKEEAENALGGWLGELYDEDARFALLSVPAREVTEPIPTFDDPEGSWEWSTEYKIPGGLLTYEGEL